MRTIKYQLINGIIVIFFMRDKEIIAMYRGNITLDETMDWLWDGKYKSTDFPV
jgi:hypothetical protein